MSKLFVACVDGESKTGKSTASEGLRESLRDQDLSVYYDSAGGFYRRLVAMVRDELKLSEIDPLPSGPLLEEVTTIVSNNPKVYDSRTDVGDIERQSIKDSVSVLGELAVAQLAGDRWYAETAKRAMESGADILVVDGRNPRARLMDQNSDTELEFILEIILECDSGVAAKRCLSSDHTPSQEQIAAEIAKINVRRERDRHRQVNPYVPPTDYERYVPGFSDAKQTVKSIWRPRHDEIDPPAPILLDNTLTTRQELMTAVADLGVASIQRLNINTFN